jgi:D-3-phosphoglycerate dehydrogenase
MLKTLITVSLPELKKLIFNKDAVRKLEEVSKVDWVPEGESYGPKELMRDIGEYDICITSWDSPKITSEVLEKAPKLKFVGHAAGSVYNIVEPCVFEKGITVVNANYALAKSTAEGTVALMMAGAWNLKAFNERMKRGEWSNNNCETILGISGQTIGLIGIGDIAREVIHMLRPYNVKILMNTKYCKEEEAKSLGVELCSLEYLLSNSNIISLHNTLTPATVGMIDKKELELVKEGSLIVNTARAAIIDEEALIEVLKKEKVYAALDVYWNEPMNKEHILLKLPNVLCVPHICGFSSYWKTRLGELVADELHRWLKGENLMCAIDAEKYARQTH